MESCSFGDVFWTMVGFWAFVLLALLLGGMTYALCACPGLRRARFRDGPPLKTLGGILALAIVSSIAGTLWSTTWRESCRIDVQGETLHLRYHLPTRTVIVPRSEIADLTLGRTMDRGDDHQIVVKTRRGEAYRSANISGPVWQKHAAALERLRSGRADPSAPR